MYNIQYFDYVIIERDNLEEFFDLRLCCSECSRTIVLILTRSAEIKGEICAREGGMNP